MEKQLGQKQQPHKHEMNHFHSKSSIFNKQDRKIT